MTQKERENMIDSFRESCLRAEKWKHNEKVRRSLYGYRFSANWEFERKARVNLKLSKFLYHGTQERRLKKILEDKTLKPNCETGEINYTGLSHKKSIYFTTCKEMARNWANWSVKNIPILEVWKNRATNKNDIPFKECRQEKAFVIAIPKKLVAHRLKLDENVINEGESFRVEGPIKLTSECMIEDATV